MNQITLRMAAIGVGLGIFLTPLPAWAKVGAVALAAIHQGAQQCRTHIRNRNFRRAVELIRSGDINIPGSAYKDLISRRAEVINELLHPDCNIDIDRLMDHASASGKLERIIERVFSEEFMPRPQLLSLIEKLSPSAFFLPLHRHRHERAQSQGVGSPLVINQLMELGYVGGKIDVLEALYQKMPPGPIYGFPLRSLTAILIAILRKDPIAIEEIILKLSAEDLAAVSGEWILEQLTDPHMLSNSLIRTLIERLPGINWNELLLHALSSGKDHLAKALILSGVHYGIAPEGSLPEIDFNGTVLIPRELLLNLMINGNVLKFLDARSRGLRSGDR